MDTMYVNHKQAAIGLGINEKTLTRMVKEKQIPFTKNGREKLYSKGDIESLKNINISSDVEQKIIMVHSGKGGTGKTTICNYLARILDNEGKKVLVVDADPQHYFSRFWGVHLEDSEKKKMSTYHILSLLEGDKKLVRCAIPVTKNFHFIAGQRKLEHYDSIFANSYGRELKMKKALEPALSKYDYIIIDTSPSQGGITVPTLFSAHTLICPIDPEVDSLDSATELAKTIDSINNSDMSTHFCLNKLYIVPIKQKNGFVRNKFQKEVLKEIKTVFNGNNFSVDIEVLDQILDHKNIPIERWQGIFEENTSAYTNYFNSFKEVFNLDGKAKEKRIN